MDFNQGVLCLWPKFGPDLDGSYDDYNKEIWVVASHVLIYF